MIFGPDSLPKQNVVSLYPIGSAQPAWVAIFRGGRISLSADRQNKLRIFLLGEHPKKAYEANYTTIRHCLNGLLPNDGSDLIIENYAYHNSYSEAELKLNLRPYILQTREFAPLPKSVSLDLPGLREFFEKGGQLKGAKLDESEGLVLYAEEGSMPKLAGEVVELSDLAVAYRAVFHAGDNEAFISLDPNIDPTKVTVNFGGYLEDTKIGSVILEADKRFKTITSGFNPNSYEDIRTHTRRYIPDFLTVAERDLLTIESEEEGKWIGTRFWFYPESIEVETDFSYRYALITSPQFTADAERSREDFISTEEFELKKKATLAPSIQRNIDHLNENYALYAKAFPELKELNEVARLMGICSWLRKSNTSWLDLDALLSVRIPEFQTDREKTQLLATCSIALRASEELNEDYIVKNSKTVYLSPILDRTVKVTFSNSTNLAKYLSIKYHHDESYYKNYIEEANQILTKDGNSKTRELIHTSKNLQALADYAASHIDINIPSDVKKLEYDVDTGGKKLAILGAEIELLAEKIEDASYSDVNIYITKHNNLVDKYEKLLREVNRKIDLLNVLDVGTHYIIEIGGGINLESKYFSILKTEKSTQLNKFKDITSRVKSDWSSINGWGNCIRSRSKLGTVIPKISIPKLNWISESVTRKDNLSFEYSQAGTDCRYWLSRNADNSSWADVQKSGQSDYSERLFSSEEKMLHFAEYASGQSDQYIVGRIVEDDKIVFSKSSRKDLMKPKEPPIWWPTQ